MKMFRRMCGVIMIAAMLAASLAVTGFAATSDYTIKDGVLKSYTGSGGDIVIPDDLGITEIGMYAFSNCGTLTSVTVPADIESIDPRAFAWCRGLTDIYVDARNGSYTSEDGVLFNKDKTRLVTYPCGKTGGYSIPSGVTEILMMSFNGCQGLTELEIPESVTTIGGSAFYGCSGLAEIVLPAGVTDIESAAFGKCDALASITVESGNTGYSSEDGVLFNKDATELICYPCGKSGSYTVPASVKTIGTGAFDDNLLVSSVTIPNGVATIGDQAFSGCYVLMKIIIPSSVTKIGDSAFDGCTNITAYVNEGSYAETYADENSVNHEYIRVTATPTTASVLVNGSSVGFEAYNINGNNYFKLRDLAQVLSGTDRQFEVGWDADKFAISLTTGESYTPVGNELTVPSEEKNETAIISTAVVYLNGVEIGLKAYNINGYNYFKLRDVGEAIDFGVLWDGETSTISVDTSMGYVYE